MLLLHKTRQFLPSTNNCLLQKLLCKMLFHYVLQSVSQLFEETMTIVCFFRSLHLVTVC